MSEMIERVARAICVAEGLDPDFDYNPNKIGNTGINIRWKLYCTQATAAIEAMRNPTTAMSDVAYEGIYVEEEGVGYAYISSDGAKRLFNDMIEEALK